MTIVVYTSSFTWSGDFMAVHSFWAVLGYYRKVWGYLDYFCSTYAKFVCCKFVGLLAQLGLVFIC